MNILEEEFLQPIPDPPDGVKELVFDAMKRAREEWDAADDSQKVAIIRSLVFSPKMFNEAAESQSEELRQAALEVWRSNNLSANEALYRWMEESLNHMVNTERRRRELEHESNRAPVAAMLDRERITIPSPEHYYHLQRSIAHPDQFKANEARWPTAEIFGKNGAMTRIQLKPDEVNSLLPAGQVDLWVERMWQKQKALNDLDADCLDILMTLWIEKAKKPGDVAVADIDDVLEMRGVQKRLNGAGRRGGYEEEQRAQVVASVCRLSDMWMEFEGPVVKRGQGKRARPEVISSRAIVITDTKGQRRLDGAIDVDKIVFQPGRVFGAFLQRVGRQTALLAHKALKYDPYRQAPEKRLTRYLSWQWKIRAHEANYTQPFSVRGLLDESGIETDDHKPARAKDRLEKALDQLLEDHIINHWEWNSEQWDEAEHGGQRGWLTRWLNATVLIEPPDEIKDHYRKLERELPPAPKPKPGADLGARLAAERKARRITQAMMAEILGINPSSVCSIERGNQKAGAKLRAKIETWLQSCQADETSEGNAP
jgi:DNA-binding XRE family transcriptional regulator